MRRNVDLSGPLLLSEAVTAAVAPLLGADGRRRLQDVVDQTLQAAPAEQAAAYRKLLRDAVPAAVVPDARLAELLDPASYLGQSVEISRRILASFPDYVSPNANGASRG